MVFPLYSTWLNCGRLRLSKNWGLPPSPQKYQVENTEWQVRIISLIILVGEDLEKVITIVIEQKNTKTRGIHRALKSFWSNG
jgi:hypothetical protein